MIFHEFTVSAKSLLNERKTSFHFLLCGLLNTVKLLLSIGSVPPRYSVAGIGRTGAGFKREDVAAISLVDYLI